MWFCISWSSNRNNCTDLRIFFADNSRLADAVAVDALNNVIQFNTRVPCRLLTSRSITGLAPGETVSGIDFRPSNGALYALGSTGQLYFLDPTTGIVTPIAPVSVPLVGTSFGFDFNPVVDRIRIVSNTGQNLSVDPLTGVAIVNAPIAPTSSVVGVAYTNSQPGAVITTLYDIDALNNVLAIQNPPAAGILTPVGPLGVTAGTMVGFDIRPLNNEALASIVLGTTSNLYRINLAIGTATLIGRIGSGSPIVGIALRGAPVIV